jgi:hypothetical protein
LDLGFFNDGLCATLGISQACRGLVARLGKLVFYPLVGGGEFGFGLVGGGEAVSDLFGTFVQSGTAMGGHTNFIVNHTRSQKRLAGRTGLH